MPIWLACKISMSVPFLFEAIRVNGDLYIDGGVMDNFPLTYFDEDGKAD